MVGEGNRFAKFKYSGLGRFLAYDLLVFMQIFISFSIENSYFFLTFLTTLKVLSSFVSLAEHEKVSEWKEGLLKWNTRNMM